MPVLSSDIKFHPSGSENLGGLINNTTEIPSGTIHALFDPIKATESLAGATDYRCIYVRNTASVDTLTAPIAYLSALPTSPGVTVEFGVGTSATNGTEQTIPDELTAPTGVSFQPVTNASTGIALGDLGPSDFRAFWIKRTVAPNTSALATDVFTVRILGETV